MICGTAVGPCTGTLITLKSTDGQRRRVFISTSRSAAEGEAAAATRRQSRRFTGPNAGEDAEPMRRTDSTRARTPAWDGRAREGSSLRADEGSRQGEGVQTRFVGPYDLGHLPLPCPMELDANGNSLTRIASWDDAPITLAQDSISGEATAELIDIGAGTTDLCRMHGTVPGDDDEVIVLEPADGQEVRREGDEPRGDRGDARRVTTSQTARSAC